MAFFLYDQNNSGGQFYYDHKAGISEEVWIEADSAKEADEKAKEIGLYFDDDCLVDCSCCGSRWSRNWYGDYDVEGEGYKSPMVVRYAWTTDVAGYVHYKDGRVAPLPASVVLN